MLSDLLADDNIISQQQLWLSADSLSVSSLEVGSEYGDEDDSDSHFDESYSYTSQSEDDCSCSSSSSEEENEPAPPKRYSRHERVKKQQRQHHPLKLLPMKSCLRKSTPDLMTSFDRFCAEQHPPAKAPVTKPKNKPIGGNARWAASSGAEKAGWSLLNDSRIGMGKESSNDCKLPASRSVGLKTRVLDVSVQQSTTTPRTKGKFRPTRTTCLNTTTTLNVTTLTVSIQSGSTSTPNLAVSRRSNTVPAILDRSPKEHRRSRRRRQTCTAGQEAMPSNVVGTKSVFRRCSSDPTSVIPELKNDRWSSSPTRRVRLDKTNGKAALSPQRTRRGSQQQPETCIPRKARRSAPNLEHLMDVPNDHENKHIVSASNNARWSANQRRLPADPSLSDSRPKMPRASAPNLWIALGSSSHESSDGSQFYTGANSRWSSCSPLSRASTPNLMTPLNQQGRSRRQATTASTGGGTKTEFDNSAQGKTNEKQLPNSGRPSIPMRRPGVQRTSSHMVRGKANASAPNLLSIRRSVSVPEPHGSVNAQWGAPTNLGNSGFSRKLGSGLSRTPSSRRPGVQRTHSRMTNNSLLDASVPNLIDLNLTNLQQSASVAHTTTTNAQCAGPSMTPPRRPGNGLGCSALSLARRGVQRTTSHMVRGSKRANASAPNLVHFRRSASVPQRHGSTNAHWGGPIQPSSLSPLPNSRLGQTISAMQRTTSSRVPRNKNIQASAPNLVELQLRRAVAAPEGPAVNAGWGNPHPTIGDSPTASIIGSPENISEGFKSTLMRAASHTRRGRLSGSNRLGISTPCLPKLADSDSSNALPPLHNAQWASNAPSAAATSTRHHPQRNTCNGPLTSPRSNMGVSAPDLANIRRSSAPPAAQSRNAKWNQHSSSELGAGPSLSMGPMMSFKTNSSPAGTGSRWDSASAFSSTSTNTLAGERPKSPPNPSQLLRNHTSYSRNRYGKSAPNLLTTNRVYNIPAVGSGNTDWRAKPSSNRNRQPTTNQALGQSLEALLDNARRLAGKASRSSNRWENGSTGGRSGVSLQMDQWSTMKRPPKRHQHKSRNKKKKSSRRHHNHKEDGAPSQFHRTDTNSSVQTEDPLLHELTTTCDAPPVPIRRTNTDDELRGKGESQAEDAMVDLVKEMKGIISSELQHNVATTEESLTHAAVSLAALEITRCARMALQKERSNRSLCGQEDHEYNQGTIPSILGCAETIPEYPHHCDDSVDEFCDKRLKAPVRYNSNQDSRSEGRGTRPQ